MPNRLPHVLRLCVKLGEVVLKLEITEEHYRYHRDKICQP